MIYKALHVLKNITIICIASSVISLCHINVVHAEFFFPANVGELRAALEDASTNGQSDVIVILPGVYDVGTGFFYHDHTTFDGIVPEDNKALFIGGLGSSFKPTLRSVGEERRNILSISIRYGGKITVADINFEGAGGNALHINNSNGNINLINNRFTNNIGNNGAGAHLQSEEGIINVFNNIFEGNRAPDPGSQGGALSIYSLPRFDSIEYTGAVRVYNNTFLNNEAEKGGGLHFVRRRYSNVLIFSNIFWDNSGSPGDLNHEFDSLTSNHTGNLIMFAHNQISEYSFGCPDPDDPCFVDYQNFDLDPLLDGFVPRSDSPVIDTGPSEDHPVSVGWIHPPVYDYRAKRRIADGNGDGLAVIDRGANEVQAPVSGSTPAPFLPLRIIPDVPESFGKLPSAPIKYIRISNVATNSANEVGWTISPERTTSGTFSVYYGNPVAGNYDTNKRSNSGTISLPQVKFEKGDQPSLSFMLYMDTQSDTRVDTLGIYANDNLVWQKSPRTITMKKWQSVTVNLSPYEGREVKLSIKFDTLNADANHTEGVYIDDIVISRSVRKQNSMQQ